MLRNHDIAFLRSLDDMELFEKRLRLLSTVRLVWIFAMIAGVGAFFYTGALLLPSSDLKTPPVSSALDEIVRPYFELCHSVVLLFLVLASFNTVLAQSEIRSLLIFKKLRAIQLNKLE